MYVVDVYCGFFLPHVAVQHFIVRCNKCKYFLADFDKKFCRGEEEKCKVIGLLRSEEGKTEPEESAHNR
tara:strand:- start:188 stop:394 length:207 start_codon:yes stop_codon:yes gene_type:complete